VYGRRQAIGWRTAGQESRDPQLRARAEGKRPEEEIPKEANPREERYIRYQKKYRYLSTRGYSHKWK